MRVRRELKIIIYANILVVALIVYSSLGIWLVIFDDSSQENLQNHELNPSIAHSLGVDIAAGEPKIPKIIHQVYRTENIPERWKENQESCTRLHPDYEYMLWTDEKAYEFIKEHYSWFLKTFEHYQFPMQRFNAMKYFALYHYGGVYIDLDDQCLRKVDPLLYSAAFVRKATPMGISNDIIGARVKHPFFLKLINSLQRYNKNWYIPYLTILSSTGPLFVSIVWKRYKIFSSEDVMENNVVRILRPRDYTVHQDAYFAITKGATWHEDDAVFKKSLGNHIMSCLVAGFIATFAIAYSQYIAYCWLCENSDVFRRTYMGIWQSVWAVVTGLYKCIRGNRVCRQTIGNPMYLLRCGFSGSSAGRSSNHTEATETLLPLRMMSEESVDADKNMSPVPVAHLPAPVTAAEKKAVSNT
ncbi:hypothetical protein DAKH74_030790 [Maudiozyma humilis]|uniref:Mannosyl phosphorylinositol ceramide synthase SUR1 n=1 Tax=Maudiozyma humilis TaxID=51915 RepID=A0AAV5RYE8_MAUHU|nr:hypothetical protein DAKH74_030790 [Kazachstania humilis]